MTHNERLDTSIVVAPREAKCEEAKNVLKDGAKRNRPVLDRARIAETVFSRRWKIKKKKHEDDSVIKRSLTMNAASRMEYKVET